MKNKILIVITSLVFVLTCLFGLAACGEFDRPSDTHTHTHSWSQSWQSNDTHHWHNCTADGCTIADNSQKDGYAEHDFTDGACVCGKEKPTEGLEYTLNSDGESYSVTGIGTATETDIVIPAKYNDTPVTSIGNRAFFYCSNLTKITIPDSVTSIGDDAFYGCSSLTSITIPDSVTSIGDSAFGGCPIETATIPAIACRVIAQSSLKTVVITSGECIGDSVFNGCRELTSITIPDSVTSIGNDAFCDCSSLTSIIIPNSVTNIGHGAFSGCSGITSITIPDSVTSIDEFAFGGCPIETAIIPAIACRAIAQSSLKTVVITSGESIGEFAFRDCSSLTSITIPDSVTSIGDNAFRDCSSLTSITIPDSVTSIGKYAFYDCRSLEEINYTGDMASWCSISRIDIMQYGTTKTLYIDGKEITDELVIPDNVTSIGDWAFRGCRGLTSVTIGNSVTSIGYYAFGGCSSLTSITIGNSVTSIGADAFIACIGLTNITIPDSVTKIGDEAFCRCSSLTSITIPDSVTSIGDRAFEGCPIETATIPAIACGHIGYYSLKDALKTVVITSGKSIGGRVFSGCSSLTSITIPDSVTNIGDEPFYGCTSLKRINYTGDLASWCGIDGLDNIPFSKVYIGNQKLIEMTSIVIPDSVTSISSYAFRNCSSLTSITIGNSVTNIGSYAFTGCSGITSITIPDSVTFIGERAFQNCSSLTNVTISENVAFIGSNAFYGCSNLRYNEYDNAYYLGNSTISYVALIKAKNTSITSCTIRKQTKVIAYSAFNVCLYIEKINYTGDIASWCGIYGLDNIIFPSKVYIGNKKLIEMTSIVIPDSVTSISEYAFQKCSKLTSVTIPDSVTNIGDSAFEGCSSLTNITFKGTIEQWNAIKKGEKWNYNYSSTDKLTIQCTDGIIATR